MTEPPVEKLNAALVLRPLQGILRNVEADLERVRKQAFDTGQLDTDRQLMLVLIMLRLAKNALETVMFIAFGEENSARKTEFALVIPTINRQLLDLLFTLVYIMDDFPKRSLAYELAGYREVCDELDKFERRSAVDAKWQGHRDELRALRALYESHFPITAQQKASPNTIDRWRTPAKLAKTHTKSQPFMKLLEDWCYGEASALAHLKPLGLTSIGLYAISDLAPESERAEIQTRKIEKFKFRQFARTVATVLAVASEIDNFSGLKNKQQLAHVWVLLGGYSDEAEELYTQRYQSMLV